MSCENKNKEEERTPGRGTETDGRKDTHRGLSRILELWNGLHKLPISIAKYKHVRRLPGLNRNQSLASWLTVGNTMARD